MDLDRKTPRDVKEYRRDVEAALAAAEPPVTDPRPREERWANSIRRLADASADPASRSDAIQDLLAGRFLGVQFDPFEIDFAISLRIAAADPDIGLRRRASEILDCSNDS